MPGFAEFIALGVTVLRCEGPEVGRSSRSRPMHWPAGAVPEVVRSWCRRSFLLEPGGRPAEPVSSHSVFDD